MNAVLLWFLCALVACQFFIWAYRLGTGKTLREADPPTVIVCGVLIFALSPLNVIIASFALFVTILVKIDQKFNVCSKTWNILMK